MSEAEEELKPLKNARTLWDTVGPMFRTGRTSALFEYALELEKILVTPDPRLQELIRAAKDFIRAIDDDNGINHEETDLRSSLAAFTAKDKP